MPRCAPRYHRPAPVVAGLLLLVPLVAGACKGAPSSPTPPPPPPPPPAALTLTGIAPASGTPGTTVSVALTGTGFAAGLTVAVSGTGVTVANVTMTSPTGLTADLVIDGYRAPLGARTVTVATAAGTSGSLPFAVEAGARFLDLGLAVRDTQTNLIWEKKNQVTGSIHHVNNAYTWCHATGNSTLTDPGLPNDDLRNCLGRSTASWIGEVNGHAFAGFNDWRVPTGTELESILRAPFPCPAPSPCIDPIFGPIGIAFGSMYWRSAPPGGSIRFTDGATVGNAVNFRRYNVRAVRNGP